MLDMLDTSESRKTTDLVKRDFYWPTLEQDVAEYVRTCDDCQRK